MRRLKRSARLVTICVHGQPAEPKDNPERIALIPEIVRLLYERPEWHPIDALVFPGGFLRMARTFGASTFGERKEQLKREKFAPALVVAAGLLDELSPGIAVVTGALAKPRDITERTEQVSLAFNSDGPIGISRKLFPTNEDGLGRRFISPFVGDYSSPHRFITLANGSVALLNSCYDAFGIGDLGTDTAGRRTAIRRLIRSTGDSLDQRDPSFNATRRECLERWRALVEAKQPDVALATIHKFQLPGRECYWQRHGIARGSAALGGALVVGAAHFLDKLPSSIASPLASVGVPKSHLGKGLSRRAHALGPSLFLATEVSDGPRLLFRLFTSTPSSNTKGGR